MTVDRLNDHVKRATGVTAGHLIRQRVLTEAKRQLVFTNQPIHEIAYELAFSDPPISPASSASRPAPRRTSSARRGAAERRSSKGIGAVRGGGTRRRACRGELQVSLDLSATTATVDRHAEIAVRRAENCRRSGCLR